MLNQGFLCLRKPRLGAHDNGQQIKPTSAAIHSSLDVHAVLLRQGEGKVTQNDDVAWKVFRMI
jgi:hypothetical protein